MAGHGIVDVVVRAAFLVRLLSAAIVVATVPIPEPSSCGSSDSEVVSRTASPSGPLAAARAQRARRAVDSFIGLSFITL